MRAGAYVTASGVHVNRVFLRHGQGYDFALKNTSGRLQVYDLVLVQGSLENAEEGAEEDSAVIRGQSLEL